MDPFSINPAYDITIPEPGDYNRLDRILDVTLDGDVDGGQQQSDSTDREISFTNPTAQSTPVEIDEEDLNGSDQSDTEKSDDADEADDNNVIFYRGPRGGKNCSLNGRSYTFDRYVASTDTTYWQCANRKKMDPQCTGRLYTKGRGEIVRMTDHRCLKSIDNVLCRITMSSITYEPSTTETPASVVSRNLTSVPESVRVILPTIDNMKRSVRRQRSKGRPAAPVDENFSIPDSFTVDADGNRFLLADKLTPAQKRLLIFGSDSCLEALQDCRTTFSYVDGTFGTAPQGFKQIWVLRSSLEDDDFGRMNFNAAFCLLPDKTTDSYKVALREIKSAAPLWSPDGIVLDYEKAEIKAIREIFPDCALCGCHFHYTQCLLRRFRKIGALYREHDV